MIVARRMEGPDADYTLAIQANGETHGRWGSFMNHPSIILAGRLTSLRPWNLLLAESMETILGRQ